MSKFSPSHSSQESDFILNMASLDIGNNQHLPRQQQTQPPQKQQQQHQQYHQTHPDSPSKRHPILQHRSNSGSSHGSPRNSPIPSRKSIDYNSTSETSIDQVEINYSRHSQKSLNNNGDVGGGESSSSSLHPAKEFIPSDRGHPDRSSEKMHQYHDSDGDAYQSSQHQPTISYRQHVYDQRDNEFDDHMNHSYRGDLYSSDDQQQHPDQSSQAYANSQAKKAIRQYLPQNSPYDYSLPPKYSHGSIHSQFQPQNQRQHQSYPQHQNQHLYQQPPRQPQPHPHHQNHHQHHQPSYKQGGEVGGRGGHNSRHNAPPPMHTTGNLRFAHKYPFIYVVNFKRTKDQFIHAFGYTRSFKTGDFVKVEADRGHDVGIISEIVLLPNHFMTEYTSIPEIEAELQIPIPQRCVLMHASEREIQVLLAKVRDETKALQVCRQLAQQRQMRLNLLDAEFQFDKNKLTFIFTSDRHIDFRELVRDLFSIFKTRIWMHKINPFQASVFQEGLAQSEPFQGAIAERQFSHGEQSMPEPPPPLHQLEHQNHQSHHHLSQYAQPSHHQHQPYQQHHNQHQPHLSSSYHTRDDRPSPITHSQLHQDALKRYLPKSAGGPYVGDYSSSHSSATDDASDGATVSSQYETYCATNYTGNISSTTSMSSNKQDVEKPRSPTGQLPTGGESFSTGPSGTSSQKY